MNKSISELDAADTIGQDDILLVSQKTANGYTSKKVLASNFKGAAGESGLPAIAAFKAEQTQINANLQTSINSVSGGYIGAFATLSELNAKTGMTTGQVAKVMNDSNTANNGDYRYTGSAWVKGYSPIDDAKAYADGNPLFKPKTLATSDDLNTIVTNGRYHKVGSSDIDVNLNHYPVKIAGVLNVFAANSSIVVQEYTVWSTADVYRRYLLGGTWSAWVQVETAVSSQAKLEAAIKRNVNYYQWFMTANNAQPVYDTTTFTLSWSSPLLAASRNHSANRIYIPAGSIVCDPTSTNGKPYGVLYLDLDKVPSTGTLADTDIAAALKFEQYPTWRGEPNLIPLAKIDKTRNSSVAMVAVNGFVPIKNSFETGIVSTSKVLEWQRVAGSNVSFDKSTKIVTISGYILAPFTNSAGRIRIRDINIQFANDFEIAYLDLTALGTNTDIDSTNQNQFIKVLPYSDSANGYRAKDGQVALIKYNKSLNTVIPAAGFVPIDTGVSSISSNIATSYIEYDKTATDLNVYIKSANGVIFRVGLQHQVVAASDTANPQSNTDLWRIYRLWECDSNYNGTLELVNSGEWECAITHTENTQINGVNKDHVGGYHGDEIQTDSKFFVDGVLKAQDFTVSGIKKADTIEFVQHSTIYFQNTTRPLCDHIKHITFSNEGVRVKQQLNFKYETVDMATAWVTMLPVLRMSGSIQVTDTSALSDDWFLQVDDNTIEGFTRRYTPIKDGKVIKQWGKDSGYSFTTTLVNVPNKHPNQSMFITNGGGYNKLYISATDATTVNPVTVTQGTIWDIESLYQFDKLV